MLPCSERGAAAPGGAALTQWLCPTLSARKFNTKRVNKGLLCTVYSSVRISGLTRFSDGTSLALSRPRLTRADVGQTAQAGAQGSLGRGTGDCQKQLLLTWVGVSVTCSQRSRCLRMWMISGSCSQPVPQLQGSPPPAWTSYPGRGLRLDQIPALLPPLTF